MCNNNNKEFDKGKGPRRVMSQNSHKYNRYGVISKNLFEKNSRRVMAIKKTSVRNSSGM